MKKMKRLMTVLLAAVMMLACGITAWALNGYCTILMKGGKEGHSYQLYHILQGDVTTVMDYSGETPVEKKIIVNPSWGSSLIGSEGFGVLAGRYNGSEEEYVKRLEEENDAKAAVQELLDANALGNPSDRSDFNGGIITFNLKNEGYYLFTETLSSEGDNSKNFVSEPILFLVDTDKDIRGAIKGSGASVEKLVAKKGFSFGDNNRDNRLEDFAPDDTSNWAKAENYAIGEDAYFLLHGQPSVVTSAFSKYEITFQDAQDECFDMPLYWLVDFFRVDTRYGETIRLNYDQNYLVQESVDGVNVRIERVEPEEDNDFAIKVTLESEDGEKLPVWCDNIHIYLRYSSKLNEKAVIGNPGNKNTCYVQDSSDPDDESKVEKSRKDSAYVFCTSLIIDKIDAEGKPLAGADFKLFRYTAEIPVPNAKKGSEYQFDAGVEHHRIIDRLYYVEIGGGEGVKTVSPDGTRFTFSGLSSGEYILVETRIPAGYTPMESQDFNLSTAFTNENGIPSISLNSGSGFLTDKDNIDGPSHAYRRKNGEFYKIPSATYYTEIENLSGSFLPETGGMGTTLFYVLGTILVTGAGVIMVARRRMAQ